MIEISNLSKKRGGRCILNDISFSINQPSLVVLLGPNGAGKTTLLRILSGFFVADSGSVKIFDSSVSDSKTKIRIGYSPEVPPLYNELTLEEYLRFVAGIRGINSKALSLSVDAVLEILQLSEYKSYLCGSLSKGMRQRASLAQAVIHKPDVLILDEPASGLDPEQLEGLNHFLKKFAERSVVLLSTHLISRVPSEIGRAIVIDSGRLKTDFNYSSRDELESKYFELLTGKNLDRSYSSLVNF